MKRGLVIGISLLFLLSWRSLTAWAGEQTTATFGHPVVRVYLGNDPTQWRTVSATTRMANSWETVLHYATFIGGAKQDEGWAIAVDEQQNTYVTGITYSDDFPCVNGFRQVYAGDKEVFVAKFDASGRLVYATYFGGSASEEGNGIAVDKEGNVYVAGETYSADLPVTPNAWQPVFAGHEDAYLLKLDPQGQLVFSTFLGGTGWEEADDVTVDNRGYVYVGGEVYSDDFPLLNPWSSAVYGEGDEDGFLSIFDTTTGQLVYSTYINANKRDQIFRLVVDDQGIVYATGMTSSPTFPVVHPFQGTYGGGWDDCFVIKFDPWHNEMLYSTFLGGADRDECWGIAIDEAGNTYVGGATSSTNFPLSHPWQAAYGGGDFDGFVAKLSPDGQTLAYSTYLGGNDVDWFWGLGIDGNHNVYVAGRTRSHNFPVVNAYQAQFGGGEWDGCLAHLDEHGQVIHASFLGGSKDDMLWRLAVDRLWNVHVTGSTKSADIVQQSPALPRGGEDDGFVAALAIVPTPTPVPPTPTPGLQAVGHIGAEGGTLWLDVPGHLTLLTVPSNKLADEATFTLTYASYPNPQGNRQGISHFFELDYSPLLTQSGSVLLPLPDGQVPLKLTQGYDHSAAEGVVKDSLALYRLEASGWTTNGITMTERSGGYVVAWVAQRGIYGLLGRAYHLYLPLITR